MVSPGDEEETQVLDIDPPLSPNLPPTDGMGCDQDTVPLDDTLPLEDLVGETQALEDPDCAADGSPDIDLWGTTQVVDEYEETDNDEGTDGTEVLSDGEGSRDDGATEKQNDDIPCSDNQGGKEITVDPDASTDEEGGGVGDHVSSASLLSGGSHQSNHGSSRKSFAAVRSASLRSSGLASARNVTPKTTDTVSTSSFSNGKYSKKQDSAIGGQNSSNGTRAGDVDLDHKIENYHRCTQDYHRDETKNRINNARVKQLFNELTPPGREETTSNADQIIGKADSPHLLVPNYAVGGLSYVGSQDPGDLSQANALDVVDDFLLANDVGSSQECIRGKRDMVKSPPISSAKGAQSLAKKSDHRSSVGKAGIFDWIDSREDEGGGEFFSKRKDAFFETRGGARKSHSQPPKARHLSSGITRGTVDKSGEKEGANPKTYLKLTSLTHSDSRLMLCNPPGNEKVHNSETKTKKNLFKNMDEPSNSKSVEQQLVTTDVDGGEEGMYNVGPDTQMAAYAMEVLLHGSPVNYKMKEDTHPVAGKATENFSKGATKKGNSSKDVLLRKRTSTPNSEGITTRSKRRKMLCAKSRRGSPNLSGKHTSKSRIKKSLEDTTVETKAKRKKWKVEGQLNAGSSVNGNGFSRSLKREKAWGTVDGAFTNDVHNCISSLTLNVQLSVTKELIPGENHVNATAVAHRTRHSRAVNLFNRTEISSSEYRKDKNGLMDVRTSGAAPVKAKRKGSNIVSDQTVKVENKIKNHSEAHDIGELREEEAKTGSLVKDSLSHPRRRRTSQIISGNSNIDGNVNNPSIPIDGLPTIIVQPSTRHGKTKKIVKNVSEILATAKRMKRSDSAQKASKSDGVPSDTGKLPIISGVRTRSSVHSPSFKPYLAKDSTECLARLVLQEAGSTDAANNDTMVVTNHSVDAEENAKLDGSPKEKAQLSYLPCTTPSKAIDAVSPVCMAQDPPRTLYNKGLSRSSIVRELIRLEATEASPTWMLKDSRRRKDLTNVRVLFSHHLDEDTIKQQKKILAHLGVPIASSMSDATHFVTDKFARTRNMLEAIALGKPVVTHMWLESCGQASCFIDEKNYILRDDKKEKEIGFSMPVSLARASRCPLLQGRRVFITPNTKPDRELLASLVKAAHGQPVERVGRSATKDDKVPDDLLVLSCEEDYAVCKPLLEKGTEVFSSELLLNGIVIQKLEFERHRLFLSHVKRTRSTIWLRHEDDSQFLPVTRCT